MHAVLNFESLLRACQDDAPLAIELLAIELLAIFRADAPNQWGLLESAVASGNPAETFDKVHRIKGALASLCAEEAALACAELEKQAAAGRALSLVELRAALQRLDSEIARRLS